MFHLTHDQLALQERARMLADDVLRDRAAEIDRTEQYPWDNVAAMNDAGFVGMTLPKSPGGQGPAPGSRRRAAPPSFRAWRVHGR